jgi:hypothetical protein
MSPNPAGGPNSDHGARPKGLAPYKQPSSSLKVFKAARSSAQRAAWWYALVEDRSFSADRAVTKSPLSTTCKAVLKSPSSIACKAVTRSPPSLYSHTGIGDLRNLTLPHPTHLQAWSKASRQAPLSLTQSSTIQRRR